MNNQSKKNYLEALVSCSVHKRVVLSCPLAFGEVGVKGRVKSVVNYKKPAFWITIVAVITCLAVALSFLTTPKTDKVDTLKSDSELEGLSVEVVSFNGDNIEIKWTNDTENEIIYGEEFYIYKQIGGGWDNCRTLKEYAWNTIAYIIKPNSSSTHKYSLDSISMVDNGNYRFESNCFIDGKSDQKYTVWVQFEIKNGTVDALSMNDGKVFFYSEPTDEHETPVIKKHADFGNEFDSFLKILKNKKWVNDNFVDRLAFNYDGKIFYGGNWIYFGYEHKVIYYDHYFCDADDDVIKTIKKIEEKAVDYTYTEKTNQNPYFNATVLEVYDNSVLVEPFSDEEIRKTSDQIYVGTDVISTNPVPNLKKGMQIRVVYNGNILESYPAVINGVFAIYELDKDGEVIFIEDIVRHIFDPVEICYSNGMYSYIASVESLPTYEIINNMELYEMYFNGPHNLHGEMTKIKLTKEKFDLRFSTDMWDKAASIRQNNKNAWEIYSPFKAGDTPLLYLLLEQNDGTFYLGYGYYNIGSNNPVTSDDSQIRFVYKLKQVENLQQANPKW